MRDSTEFARTGPPTRLHPRATVAAVVVPAALAAAVLAARPLLPDAWSTPGSAVLYLAGVVGALLVLVPFAFSVTKRGGLGHSPPAWFVAHLACGSLGTALLLVHSSLNLGRAPALVLAGCAFLVLQGLWARLRLPDTIAATFGSRHETFLARDRDRDRNRDRNRDRDGREALGRLIEAKRALLARLDGQADEATFSPVLGHWMRHPWLTTRYVALAREESAIVGERARVPPAQIHWRALHIAVALGVLVGILVHVVTVTFFAGYVADGGPVHWWHITAWGG